MRHRRLLTVVTAGLALAACAGPGVTTSPTPSPPSAATSEPTGTTPGGATSDPTTSPPSTGSPSTVPTVAPASLLGTVWTVIPTDRKRVALTFDCGANADGLPSILATLADRRVARATFFVTGDWARAFPAEAAQLGRLGYVVGNHTDHHLRLPELTDAQVRREVRQGRLAVLTATGVDPKPWFRFPFGAYDPRTLGLVADAGWVVLGWTVDTLGWQGTSGGQSAESVVARVLDGLRPGAIVLMHVGSHPRDGSTLDADALPTLVHQLRALGYRFTTPRAML